MWHILLVSFKYQIDYYIKCMKLPNFNVKKCYKMNLRWILYIQWQECITMQSMKKDDKSLTRFVRIVFKYISYINDI